MRLVWMNGGLGNQLFQYIFYRYLEETTGDVCYIDDRFFFHSPQHNGYEINRIFGLKPNLLSEYFDSNVWEIILEETKRKYNIIDYLGEFGMNAVLVTEGDAYYERYKHLEKQFAGDAYTIAYNSYKPGIAALEGNLYYHGYWINMHWFKYIRDIIIRELAFPAITDDYNKNMADKIVSTHSVGVHIRRGDFVQLNQTLGNEWYKNAVTKIKLTVYKPVFFIFSDDTEWCGLNTGNLGFTDKDEMYFIDGNKSGDSYRDMQLLSLCQNMIIANSSFSYLAALLNQNPNKYILNPVEFREIV